MKYLTNYGQHQICVVSSYNMRDEIEVTMNFGYFHHCDTTAFVFFCAYSPLFDECTSKILFCQVGDCFLRFVIGLVYERSKYTSLSHRYSARPLRKSRSLLDTNCFKIITADYMLCLCNAFKVCLER